MRRFFWSLFSRIWIGIQSKYRKVRTRNNSVFGHFSRSDSSKRIFIVSNEQKKPSRDLFKKRCFENMQQIYKRTPMRKCDFKNLLHIFRTPFTNNTSGWLLLYLIGFSKIQLFLLFSCMKRKLSKIFVKLDMVLVGQ